jgi:hypothetical protein
MDGNQAGESTAYNQHQQRFLRSAGAAMTTPNNPDAVTRVPRTPPPMPPVLGFVGPPSFTRALRQHALLASTPAGASPVDEPDSEGWYSIHWIHAAFLAREAMEQAFAAHRGGED